MIHGAAPFTNNNRLVKPESVINSINSRCLFCLKNKHFFDYLTLKKNCSDCRSILIRSQMGNFKVCALMMQLKLFFI